MKLAKLRNVALLAAICVTPIILAMAFVTDR